MRITKKGATRIAQYLALYDGNEVLRDTVVEQLQVIAQNPNVGRPYGGPGQFYTYIFQCLLEADRGVACCMMYQVTNDEVFIVGCGRVAF